MSDFEFSNRARRPQRNPGFTLVEVVLVIIILGLLAGMAIPAFVSMSKEAESASAEHMTGTLASALNIYSSKQLLDNLTITSHNPFEDLATQPGNYAGAFGDVDLTNCQPGQWAYQSGNGSNGNWPIVVYRAKATLANAFGWSGAQWIIYEVNPVLDSRGNTVGVAMIEYPPQHQW